MQIRLLALAAFAAAAGLAAGAGRLLAVRPAGDAGASVIELVGDRPLSFTSLRLASPPRVVVDVADADPSGVAGAQVVDDGTVRRVAVAAVGSIARVVIELAGESEFDVRAVGAVLQVRVARLSPLVAKAEPPREAPPPAVRPDGPPEPVPEPPPEPGVALQGPPVPEPSLPAATPQPTPPAPAPAAAEPRETAPVAIAAPPPVGIPAPSEAAPGPAEPPATRAELPPAAPEPQAPAENPAPPQVQPSPEPAATPRATAPAVVAEVGPPPPAAATPRAQPASPPPAAARPPPAETAAAPKAPPERRVARAEGTASREEVERARASIPTVSIVASPPPAAAPAPPPATAPGPPAARTRASITGIGFRPSAGGIVLVRSDRPLDYAVTGEGRVVIVHLRGAGIPIPTNRLPLDTRFFDTSVVRVVPESVAGGIDLRIELRGQARYQLSQASGLLTIAFERT